VDEAIKNKAPEKGLFYLRLFLYLGFLFPCLALRFAFSPLLGLQNEQES
jgi:hypothetical protein